MNNNKTIREIIEGAVQGKIEEADMHSRLSGEGPSREAVNAAVQAMEHIRKGAFMLVDAFEDDDRLNNLLNKEFQAVFPSSIDEWAHDVNDLYGKLRSLASRIKPR